MVLNGLNRGYLATLEEVDTDNYLAKIKMDEVIILVLLLVIIMTQYLGSKHRQGYFKGAI